MGGSNARAAVDSRVHDMGQKKWYVTDMGKVYGPMSWYDIKSMADKAQVSPFAQIREETWPQWAPLHGIVV